MDSELLLNATALSLDLTNQSVCRACLSEECSNAQSLFENGIDRMLMCCASIQVSDA